MEGLITDETIRLSGEPRHTSSDGYWASALQPMRSTPNECG